jgi:histidyl-tRNA synthetase
VTSETLRGFRDYPPPEAGARSTILTKMREAARLSGYVELEGPSVEPLDLFTAKSGEEIAAQVWAFRDKGGRDVALVPETTPSLARIYAERAKAEPIPVKWFTISKLWRYEEPQAGRTREFSQFNIDILGVPGVEAEVDVLSTAAAALDAAGARDLYAFRLNDRALAEGIGYHFGARDRALYFRAVDRFRKSSSAEFEQGLKESGVSSDSVGELEEILLTGTNGVEAAQAEELFHRLERLGLTAEAHAGLERLRTILRLGKAAGVEPLLWVDPTVVRGLAYYTSTVFEAFDRGGQARALFGGGRYDHLIELFGGPPTPACGLAIGDQTLERLLKENGRWPEGEPPLDTYVVTVRPELFPEALRLVRELRAEGRSADVDPLGRSFPRQLKEAARRRARRAWILGLKEASPGAVVERDLSTGEQREIPRGAG